MVHAPRKTATTPSRVCDVTTGAEIRRIEAGVPELLYATFSSDGRSIRTDTSGGVIKIWSVSVDALLARAASPV